MKTKLKTYRGEALIILAGIFWGSMGIFVRRLAGYGFTSIQIVAIRVTLAAALFCAILLATDRRGFKISLRDLPLFLGLGIGSILFFTVCYFTAISMMSLSMAAILLYTSPIWIMLMSAVFFREKITAAKLTALALAFGGCVLVCGFGGGEVSPAGVLTGLGSGIGYGLYSILGTVALKRYSPYTVTVYTFLFASLGALAICSPGDMASKYAAAPAVLPLTVLCVLTAVVTAVVPFLSYTLGLQTVEAGRAGILATVEPMVATVIGAVVFSEPLGAVSLAGIAMILSSVVMLNLKRQEPKT